MIWSLKTLSAPDAGEESWVVADNLYAFTTSQDEASRYVTARPLRIDVGSQAATLQMKAWVEECKDHEECSKSHTQTEATLPTRVIEVRPADQDEPRILETCGLRGSYATISYCWGKTLFWTLNTSNYAQSIKSLDISMLPLVFQDAITIARKLSIPYLWIDALCIIQDSEDDKEQEIALMKNIYASSVLTIVAASSKEVSEGILLDRPSSNINTFTIPFRIKDGLFGSFSFGSLAAVVYDERSEPLARRAWTLQEQLLAQRTVTFASHTMIWNCKAGVKTFGEFFHSPYQNSIDKSESLNLNSLLIDEEEARAYKFEALSCWCRLVTAYSLRCASFENDKLNAVAGIASHPSFASALGTYHAGLWEYKFALQLTWYVSKEHVSVPNAERLSSHRPKSYRAPSWSWASIEGGVVRSDDQFGPHNLMQSRCEILECSTAPKLDRNPFGEVVSASLRIRGFSRSAWFYPETSNLVLLPVSDFEIGVISHQEAYKQYIQDFIKETPEVDIDERPEALHGTWNNNTVGNSDETRFTEPMIVLCLAVAWEWLSPDKTVSGLLLVEEGNGLYTRVGQFMRGKRKDFKNEEILKREITLI
ncbi:heterokaryon incompatibility protein-domain-containing protein [Fusarium avenaceum]|nr:heterokaryon incompatibility protein-domain-containing protein [Fusarium avenaceum]